MRRISLRVLLSEGSSTSAREAITALGLAGHRVEICDPDPHCLGRFSRFVAKFHRCPGLADDPQGYLAFMRDLVARERFDALLPIHEQGYLFAKVPEQFAPHVALALPDFDGYASAHSKAGFSRMLTALGLPQPATTFVTGAAALRAAARLPYVVKTALGTASRGTWIVEDAPALEQAVADLTARDAFADEVLVQDFLAGPVEHAQAVFARGALVAMHAYRQIARGAGGGPAIKGSVRRPAMRGHLARIGEHLAWHGALSVDYILAGDTPRYIDCNPRLVEPASALFAGLDLTDMLLRVSLGETPAAPESREGVRTHLAMQALLGCALAGGTRRDILRECGRLLARRGPYAGSREELTPLSDWPSALPALATAVMLLANPHAAHGLPEKRFGAHLLTREAIRTIRERM